jgi:hypothetical protein
MTERSLSGRLLNAGESTSECVPQGVRIAAGKLRQILESLRTGTTPALLPEAIRIKHSKSLKPLPEVGLMTLMRPDFLNPIKPDDQHHCRYIAPDPILKDPPVGVREWRLDGFRRAMNGWILNGVRGVPGLPDDPPPVHIPQNIPDDH